MTDEQALAILSVSMDLIQQAHVAIVHNGMRQPFVNGKLDAKLGTAYALIGDSIKLVKGETP